MKTLREILVEHEGFELKPYRCTKGKLTIGVGRNLDDRGISPEEAVMLFENDIAACEAQLDQALPEWQYLSDARQVVLVSMVFNLGIAGFMNFKKMIEALHVSDFALASKEMLDSKWAREDVPARAAELAEMMLEG